MGWAVSDDGDSVSGGNSPLWGGQSFAGGGVWNVATSGATARNSGGATTPQGVPVGSVDYSQYIPLGLGFLALVLVWKMLKK